MHRAPSLRLVRIVLAHNLWAWPDL
jgi:hypothetical protein